MLLENAWYIAAWSHEVSRRLFTRTILDQSILLFRKEDGTPVAVRNRCPHRFAPLSLGTLHADVLECGYHGLRFDMQGKCVRNPHGKIPPTARLKVYPSVERFGLLWIWMGEESVADPSTLPDFSHLADQSRATVGGVATIRAHYELVMDNLMDLTHVQFVHKSFFNGDAASGSDHEVTQSGNTVHSALFYPNGTPSRLFAKAMPECTSLVDHWFDIRWDPPALMCLTAGMTPAGRPRSEGVSTIGSHLLTPETETTTHYFYANTRSFAVGDAAMDEHFASWQRIAFGEQDKPMIEAVQTSMGSADLLSLKPTLLATDAAAIRARRALARLIAEERARVAS